jgi:hypothetical protein
MGPTKHATVRLGIATFSLLIGVGLSGACSTGPSSALLENVRGEGADATVTEGGLGCATPNDGCPCARPGEVVACGKVFRTSKDYIACSMGERTCGTDGTWGTCVGDSIAQLSLPGETLSAASVDNGVHVRGLGASTSCTSTNPCDPACANFVDTPNDLDAGPDATYRVVDGGIVPNSTTTTCPVGTLFCNLVKCPLPGASTDLKGVVYDPAGRNPLSGVTVFVPTTTAPLPPIPVGPVADPCGGVPQVNALASAVTDVNGNFTLKNIPSGINVPLVVQLGKWRRQFTILAASITSCVTNDLTAATSPVLQTLGGVTRSLLLPMFRLPATQAEGNIPQMGLSLGAYDQLACLFPKIGLDFSEFSSNSNSGRMHIFAGLDNNGGKYGTLYGAAAPDASAKLWDSLPSLKKYDIVITSCEGAENNQSKPATSMQAVHDFLDSGGRFFATHFHYTWFKNNPKADFKGVAAWTSYDRTSNTTNPFSVVTWAPRNNLFRDWLAARGALDAPATANRMTIGEWREDMYEPLGSSVSWIENPKGTKNDQGNTRQSTKYMTFNTPIANAPASQYGKAVISDIHVSPGDSTSDVPSSCQKATAVPCVSDLECSLIGGKTCNATSKTCYNASGKQIAGLGLLPCTTDAQCGGGATCTRGRCLNAMTAQEKALEYLFFDLGACVTDVSPPIPQTLYSDAALTRDYVATCPAQQQPRWTFFDYQGDFPGAVANDPSGTSMELRFTTATTQAALDATAKPGSAAATVRGKQTVTAWTGIDVSPTLPGGKSQSFLRVFIDLKPSTDRLSAPTLTAWRQSYTCVDAE